MKYIFTIFAIVSICVPTVVRADPVLSDQEAWAYLYEFTYTWDGAALSPTEPYRISSGDKTVLAAGAWSLDILDGQRNRITRYSFDPGTLARDGVVSLKVPVEGRGAYAEVRNAEDASVNTMSIMASRVCDDDGVCEKEAGEADWICPTDCGPAVASGDSSVTTATIGAQVPIGARVGSLLLRLSLAAAGVVLLVGTARMLDSRKTP